MTTAPGPFQVNDVFMLKQPVSGLQGRVRLVHYQAFERVVLIKADFDCEAGPTRISYKRWVELFDDDAVEKTADPFLDLCSRPGNLPDRAKARLDAFMAAVPRLVAENPNFLLSRRSTSVLVTKLAAKLGCVERTAKRQLNRWLKAGSNPAGIVMAFATERGTSPVSPQAKGDKRGRKAVRPDLASAAPAQEVLSKITQAYDIYVCKRSMSWDGAYQEMLAVLYEIPREHINGDKELQLFLSPVLMEKFRVPTWNQFRYRVRLLHAARRALTGELPLGYRGKATDSTPGPGFFEIDATFFQIQLVSRLSASNLVGRPTVYLIVDIFSGVIVGYTVSLESPSWALAALALYNCFSDKGAVFRRLALPYTAQDWPCHQLPTVLRADRAEIVSNMGQEFPSSGIRVNVPPPMTPEGKGTVEGKNSELKKKPKKAKGRFDLPGLFAKHRKRREGDGKRQAALNLFDFERILVEIIMDLNKRPVRQDRIPRDALSQGGKVASRVGLYKWGITNRPGFTRCMGAHFLYEHLLKRGKGKVTPAGIKFDGEVFNCDRLRELGLLVASLNGQISINVSYNPIFAGEVFFLDRERGAWTAARNTDAEVLRASASFAEAKDFRALKAKLHGQAALAHHAHGLERAPFVKDIVQAAKANLSESQAFAGGAPRRIRENRRAEKASHRQPIAPISAAEGALASSDPGDARLLADPHKRSTRPATTQGFGASEGLSKLQALWKSVKQKGGTT